MNRATPLITWPPLALSVAFCTGAVGAEVATPVSPIPSAAPTVTASVWPRSSRPGWYVAAVAWAIGWPSRSHW